MTQSTKTVYSTDPDWKANCPQCHLPEDQCRCNKVDSEPAVQKLKLQLEKKGRKGKSVTVVYGHIGDKKKFLKQLQAHCGTGGTVKKDTVELQGDQRQKIKTYLEKSGHHVKISGA